MTPTDRSAEESEMTDKSAHEIAEEKAAHILGYWPPSKFSDAGRQIKEAMEAYSASQARPLLEALKFSAAQPCVTNGKVCSEQAGFCHTCKARQALSQHKESLK